MKVRLRIAWRQWPKGHVFTAMPAAQAEVMVRAGQAEYCREDVPSAPVDRALRAAIPNRQSAAPRRRARR